MFFYFTFFIYAALAYVMFSGLFLYYFRGPGGVEIISNVALYTFVLRKQDWDHANIQIFFNVVLCCSNVKCSTVA